MPYTMVILYRCLKLLLRDKKATPNSGSPRKVQIMTYDIDSPGDVPEDAEGTVQAPHSDDLVVVGGDVEAPSETKTVDELAHEVLKGEWGKGQDRRRRLAEAGHDATAVQVAVVRLLNPKR